MNSETFQSSIREVSYLALPHANFHWTELNWSITESISILFQPYGSILVRAIRSGVQLVVASHLILRPQVVPLDSECIQLQVLVQLGHYCFCNVLG